VAKYVALDLNNGSRLGALGVRSMAGLHPTCIILRKLVGRLIYLLKALQAHKTGLLFEISRYILC
jgi:hypothetical protein